MTLNSDKNNHGVIDAFEKGRSIAITIAGFVYAGVVIAATVIFIMLLGEFLEHLTVGKARRAISSLVQLAPKTAWIRREQEEVRVPIEEVKA